VTAWLYSLTSLAGLSNGSACTARCVTLALVYSSSKSQWVKVFYLMWVFHDTGQLKGSPYSITECRILIPVLGSQHAGDVSHKPGGRLPLLSTRPAVTLARRLNLDSVFLCLFCVMVHYFWLATACFCCVRFSFFHIMQYKLEQQTNAYQNIGSNYTC